MKLRNLLLEVLITEQLKYQLEEIREGVTSATLTVFPHIRPAGIIFLQGLQLRGLLECGYYSRAGIIF